MQKKQAVFLLLWLAVGFCRFGFAEIAVPAEPVGNATDRAVAEKQTRRSKAKQAKQLAKDKAHRLAHPHPKKHHKARKITQAEGKQP